MTHDAPLGDRPEVLAAIHETLDSLDPTSARLVAHLLQHPVPVTDLPNWIQRCIPMTNPDLPETNNGNLSESERAFADHDEDHPPPVADIRSAAKAYLAAGYQIVPLLPGLKKTLDTNWPERFYSIDSVKPDSNLGLKCIPTVVDIDCYLALKCADDFLPTTPRIDGRPGKPRSHRFYVTDLEKSADFTDIDRSMIAQILVGSGKQAVVPPSLWVNEKNREHQERRTWIDGSVIGPPASTVEGPFLRDRVLYMATVALIARHWPEHGRRLLRLAYSRVFLETLKLDNAVSTRILEWACTLGGSDRGGVNHVASAIEDTQDKLDQDEPAIGGTTVSELLPPGIGDQVIAKLREWYGIRPASLIITRASAVADEPLELGFGGRLIRGNFPFVVGPSEAGKGMFFVFIVACLTTGAPFPGEITSRPPMNVLVCVTEDSKGRVKSRLRAAGADLDRVHFVEGPEVMRGGLTMPSPMMLDDDAGQLVRDAKRYEAGALFLETVVEHFGDRAGKSRRNMNSVTDVRNALAPFRAICHQGRLYGVGVIHPRKSTEGGVEDSISGSAAFFNVPRGTMHIYKDPKDTTTDRVRLLFTGKGSYLSHRPETLRFRIRSWDEERGIPCGCGIPNCGHEGRIVWEDDLMDPRSDEDIWKQIVARGKPRRDVAVQEAEEFLQSLMVGDTIAMVPDGIFTAAREEGLSREAIRRAKKNLKLVSLKSNEFPADVIGWKRGKA